ncbi:cytochrome D1 domain-containing protein [Gemmatimonas sp.]|uniref:YVTN family beta-propeller repeat protein n=1 Tax=Gemmatimonas sp. TaxID=1962908 RepID=UPI0039836ADE
MGWKASIMCAGAIGAGASCSTGTNMPTATAPQTGGVVQAPALPGAPGTSSRDRVYTADQTSNTVSVIDAGTNTLLGTIALGDARPNVLGALYNKQIDVHGLGFSPDGTLLSVISVTSNAVTIIETATNRVRGTLYVGRAPHEGFFRPDGRELWVAVRGEGYVSVIDPVALRETRRIPTSDGVAMVIFRPDGRYAFVNSSRTAALDVVDTRTYEIVRRIPMPSKFSPNLAASPDGQELWLTLKDVGKTVIVDAQSFAVLGTLDTGPVTNHVNFVTTVSERLAYVTVGGENVVKVYRRNGASPTLVATIPVSDMPHGLWPSADNRTVYVGQENADSVAVIDVATQRVTRQIPVGQAPQALVFVANAVPTGAGTANLTRQNVGLRIERRRLPVPGAAGAKGKAVIRSLGPIDVVEIALRDAPSGAMLDVYAVQNDAAPFGRVVKLAHLMVRNDGTAEVAAQLRFFDSGFSTVVLVPVGQIPVGATTSSAAMSVNIVALAGHCAMH